MEQKTIEKVLNRIAEERLEDHQELKLLKVAQEKQNQLLENDREEIILLNKNLSILKMEQQTLFQQTAVPIKQMETIGSQIEQHAELLKKPLVQKTVHIHHLPRLLIATVVLFCIAIGISIGWYQTGHLLNQYQNNDTKWRRLLLDANTVLTKIMQDVSDSVEQDPDKIRAAVKAEEDHNLKVWNLAQKMKADSAEMRSLVPNKPPPVKNSSSTKKK